MPYNPYAQPNRSQMLPNFGGNRDAIRSMIQAYIQGLGFQRGQANSTLPGGGTLGGTANAGTPGVGGTPVGSGGATGEPVPPAGGGTNPPVDNPVTAPAGPATNAGGAASTMAANNGRQGGRMGNFSPRNPWGGG